jgi:hypothetical protein
MGPTASRGDRAVRRRGWVTLASLLAVELVALIGSRLIASVPARSNPPPSRPASRPGPAQTVRTPPAPVRVGAAPKPVPPPALESPAAPCTEAPPPDHRPAPPAPPIPEASPPPPPPPSPADPRPRRVVLRDETGMVRVARLYACEVDPTVVQLPDGQLGVPSGLSFTDEPFVVERADQIAERLTRTAFPGFDVHATEHYVVLYEGSDRFAEASGNLLESLYAGLLRKLGEKGLPVREAEFPLVAVIFRDEAAFRAHSEMPPDVTAYYHVLSNRIYLYETSEALQAAPDVAARRRPQTVAHEGTHQVLQNIGLHTRLASWPPWLVEGLAEYFAPTTTTRDGDWGGANRINPFHMATIRDLHDPLSIQLQGRGLAQAPIGRDPRTPLVEYLVTRTELTPTDYALSWALTHFLANKRFDDFLAYLRELSARKPLQRATPAEHLATFRKHFGKDLAKLDRALQKHLASLKNFESIPYYAVTFEQPVGRGVIRRGAMVSQSPAMIRQWIDDFRVADGGPVTWHAQPFPTRTRARLAAEQWLNGP